MELRGFPIQLVETPNCLSKKYTARQVERRRGDSPTLRLRSFKFALHSKFQIIRFIEIESFHSELHKTFTFPSISKDNVCVRRRWLESQYFILSVTKASPGYFYFSSHRLTTSLNSSTIRITNHYL